MGASTAQSSDMLRQAQEICDEAEERTAAAEKCGPPALVSDTSSLIESHEVIR